MIVVEKGDFVRINYVGRLESGEIFDLTMEDVAKKENIYNPKFRYKPVPIIVGAEFTIRGLDNAVLGMNVGEKKTVEIEPKNAFGERDPKNIRVVPNELFKKQNMEPRQGMVVDFSGIKGRIQSVSAGRVMVDFNNPLAGKKLKYELEVAEKIEKPEEQAASILEFFGIENAKVTIAGKIADVEARVPVEMRERLSDLIMKNVKAGNESLEKVRFVDIYGKK